MKHQPIKSEDLPDEIDFSKGVRGLHHIPAGAKVQMPAAKRSLESRPPFAVE